MSESKIVWHKYPMEKPKKEGFYLVTEKVEKNRYVSISLWLPSEDRFTAENTVSVTAWEELPETYKEEE